MHKGERCAWDKGNWNDLVYREQNAVCGLNLGI